MESLLTAQEVADLLGVPIGSLHRWRYTGTGPRAVIVGRHVRFRATDVESWLDRQPERARRTRKMVGR